MWALRVLKGWPARACDQTLSRRALRFCRTIWVSIVGVSWGWVRFKTHPAARDGVYTSLHGVVHARTPNLSKRVVAGVVCNINVSRGRELGLDRVHTLLPGMGFVCKSACLYPTPNLSKRLCVSHGHFMVVYAVAGVVADLSPHPAARFGVYASGGLRLTPNLSKRVLCLSWVIHGFGGWEVVLGQLGPCCQAAWGLKAWCLGQTPFMIARVP